MLLMLGIDDDDVVTSLVHNVSAFAAVGCLL
jgi:hypothetical protein